MIEPLVGEPSERVPEEPRYMSALNEACSFDVEGP